MYVHVYKKGKKKISYFRLFETYVVNKTLIDNYTNTIKFLVGKFINYTFFIIIIVMLLLSHLCSHLFDFFIKK